MMFNYGMWDFKEMIREVSVMGAILLTMYIVLLIITYLFETYISPF